MAKAINYADLIGVKFKNRGRDITSGVDCYGLVMEVYKRCGVELPEYTADFDNMDKINSIFSGCIDCGGNWKKIDLSSLKAPCLIAIRFGSPPGVVNHAGCYIGNGKFIHIRENIGVCIDNINSPAWRKVIVGFYEYIGDHNDNVSHS